MHTFNLLLYDHDQIPSISIAVFPGKVHNGDQSTFGIQIYPACGGSLASGVLSNLLVNSSDLDSDVRSAVRHALAGGMYQVSFLRNVQFNHFHVECGAN